MHQIKSNLYVDDLLFKLMHNNIEQQINNNE